MGSFTFYLLRIVYMCQHMAFGEKGVIQFHKQNYPNFTCGYNKNLHLTFTPYALLCSKKKYTSGVNFINILQAAFAPIILRRKLTKPNCQQKKFSAQDYRRKRCS